MGESFGILIVWIAISCMTLPLIQIFVRRKAESAAMSIHSHVPERGVDVDSPSAEELPVEKSHTVRSESA